MTFTHLANLFQNWGWEVPRGNFYRFDIYLREMLKRDRVMVVMNGPFIVAVLLFYLTDDFSQIYKKGTWDVAEDNPYGHQLYIDKFICKRFTPLIHRIVKEAVLERFPNVTEAFYHRGPRDRLCRVSGRPSLIFQKI